MLILLYCDCQTMGNTKQVVIEHLRQCSTTSMIALWGRSMGAATALLHAERDPSIACMVLDSAFADLVMLAEEMVERGRQAGAFAPGFVVSLGLKKIASSVLSTAHFDIKSLAPIRHVHKCFIPAMFVAGEQDSFVGKNHSALLFSKYSGDKEMLVVDGDHNSRRPIHFFDQASSFLVFSLQIPDSWLLAEGQLYVRRTPWSYKEPLQKSSGSQQEVLPSMLSAQDYLMLNKDELLALQIQRQFDLEDSENNQKIAGEEHSDLECSVEMSMQQQLQDSLYNMLTRTRSGGVSPVTISADRTALEDHENPDADGASSFSPPQPPSAQPSANRERLGLDLNDINLDDVA